MKDHRSQTTLIGLVRTACLALVFLSAAGSALAQPDDRRGPRGERKSPARIEGEIAQECAKLKKAYEDAGKAVERFAGSGRRGRGVVDRERLYRLETDRENTLSHPR